MSDLSSVVVQFYTFVVTRSHDIKANEEMLMFS